MDKGEEDGHQEIYSPGPALRPHVVDADGHDGSHPLGSRNDGIGGGRGRRDLHPRGGLRSPRFKDAKTCNNRKVAGRLA
jgi:hypothetical protein